MKRPYFSIAAIAFAALFIQAAQGFAGAQTYPQASPQPAPPAQTQLPAANATATPAPPKDVDANRIGISGVWEVQIQRSDGTVYTHFKLAQSSSGLSGQYLDEHGKKFPLQGTVDGKDVHIVVTLADGTALVFTGNVDGNTDMAGTLDSSKDTVGFTAEYRPKYKWIDNLSPNPVGNPGNPGVP
ncbi:MAG TPA: hypothetical protein VKT72_02080 [Candidatus Baltobacteraceae bacterium]|nr:hypothetical protein [Candidatus Baltobacteraceae bacterium]